MADDYIEIKDLSDVEKKPKKSYNAKKSTKKNVTEHRLRKRKMQADYTWLWVVLILVAIAVVLIVVLSQPKTIETIEPEITDELAATVSGENIMMSEVEELYNRVPELYQAVYTKEIILDQLINEKLLLQEAKKQGFTASQKDIDNELNLLKLQLPPGQTLEQMLESQNLTLEATELLIHDNILRRKLINHTVLSKVSVTENEMKDYFDSVKIGNMTFDEVKEQVEETLMAEKQTKLLEEYIDELREDPDIKVFYGAEELPEEEEETTTTTAADEKDEKVTTTTLAKEEEKTTTTTPAEKVTTTTLAEEEDEEGLISVPNEKPESCIERQGIAETDIIFYYTTTCPYCITMSSIVQTFEVEGITFYWAEYYDEKQIPKVTECFELNNEVPQFICPKTGEIKVGTLKESSLRAFVAGCV